MSDIQNGQFTRTNSFGPTRDPVQPRFHIEPVQDYPASADAGRPIFKQEERVQFIMPGNPGTSPVARVTDEHRQRWPEQYAAFRRGEEMSVEGTPLEQWPPLSKAMVLELKAIGLHSVEQIAEMPDTAVQRVGRGGYGLRERAKAYLDDAVAGALTERLNREAEAKDARISALERQVSELKELSDRLHSQYMSQQAQPSAVATFVQGQHDPMEMARMGMIPPAPEPSSLDRLSEPVRRRSARKDAA